MEGRAGRVGKKAGMGFQYSLDWMIPMTNQGLLNMWVLFAGKPEAVPPRSTDEYLASPPPPPPPPRAPRRGPFCLFRPFSLAYNSRPLLQPRWHRHTWPTGPNGLLFSCRPFVTVGGAFCDGCTHRQMHAETAWEKLGLTTCHV